MLLAASCISNNRSNLYAKLYPAEFYSFSAPFLCRAATLFSAALVPGTPNTAFCAKQLSANGTVLPVVVNMVAGPGQRVYNSRAGAGRVELVVLATRRGGAREEL